MRFHSLLPAVLGLTVTLAPVSSKAAGSVWDILNVAFVTNQSVSDEQLSDIRGGFLLSSGMVVNMGLITKTLVNGHPVEHTEVNISQLQHIDPAALQTLVQVNQDGTVQTRKLGLENIPQIVNVVQNSANNVVVDNLAILNLDVDNISRFRSQSQTALMNFQNSAVTLR